MKAVKQIIGLLLIMAGIILGSYVGVWVMFIKPIIDCCKAFDSHTLTAFMIGVCVLKCIFASFVSGIIIYFSTLIGKIIMRF